MPCAADIHYMEIRLKLISEATCVADIVNQLKDVRLILVQVNASFQDYVIEGTSQVFRIGIQKPL
jgi:hypothetical protein